jgi:hypothetical protein
MWTSELDSGNHIDRRSHDMKIRKVLTSAAVTIALLAPAGSALASSEEAASGASTADTSTTVPSPKSTVRNAEFRARLQEWQEATRSWIAGRAAALRNHRETVAAASATLKEALESATNKEGRRAAMTAFKSAREAANSSLKAALETLGSRPLRPTK